MRREDPTSTLTIDNGPVLLGVVCEVLDGSGVKQRQALKPGTWRLGGEDDNDVVLDDRTVSREHALLEVGPQGVRVTDRGSRNGTWYLGARVSEVLVPAGATIRFGKAMVRFAAASAGGQQAVAEVPSIAGLLGVSLAMRQLTASIRRVALVDAAVLVRGETGVGKEAVARAVHSCSPRAGGPFVVFDGGRANPELIESDLFGHRRGAFTGAVSTRSGAVELADRGTLFLDEVGELPLELQARLLRVLETGSFTRLGDTAARRSSFRVVSATHRDLEQLVREGRFREDLYFRLAVVVLDVPPLRERRDDIAVLAESFANGRGIDRVSLATWAAKEWPGNVRELKNAVERLHAGSSVDAPVEQPLANRQQVMGDVERELILQALERHCHDVEAAAGALGLSRSQLYRVMKRHGIATRRGS